MLTLLFVVLFFASITAVVLVRIGRMTRQFSLSKPLSDVPIGPAWLGRVIPADPLRALVTAVVVSALLGVGLVFVGLYFTRHYGWTVFVVTPFVMGFVSASLVSYHREPAMSRCALAAFLGVLTAGLGFFALGLEGLICLLMAVPLAGPAAVTGAMVAFHLQTAQRRVIPTALGMMLCAMPLMLTVEPALIGGPAPSTLRTAIEIDAPPAAVWAHLIEFVPITAPLDTWLFRAGVAYPISARLSGKGVGALRVCEFSTGRFVETIREWDERRELMFTVDEAPPVLREWTPYQHLAPPHLHGYFDPESADFKLVALAGGRTRLEGTSVYRNRMWPLTYWSFWSDAIVRRVHRRVFEHVKQLAEMDRRGSA
jgi:hypothetical protein